MCHPSEKGVKGVAYLARHPFESLEKTSNSCVQSPTYCALYSPSILHFALFGIEFVEPASSTTTDGCRRCNLIILKSARHTATRVLLCIRGVAPTD